MDIIMDMEAIIQVTATTMVMALIIQARDITMAMALTNQAKGKKYFRNKHS
jgi:hypothetical protein